MEKSEIVFHDEVTLDAFDEIVVRFLWHEPHSLGEILIKLENENEPFAFSKRAFKRRVWSALMAAIDCGVLRREKGYFLLTGRGRTEFQKKIKELFDSRSLSGKWHDEYPI